MPEIPRMRGSLGRTVLATFVLAFLCVACGRINEGSEGGANGIRPISSRGGEKDIAGSGEASVEWVEVSTLATNLAVPWPVGLDLQPRLLRQPSQRPGRSHPAPGGGRRIE
jgi:hypothetical protein